MVYFRVVPIPQRGYLKSTASPYFWGIDFQNVLEIIEWEVGSGKWEVGSGKWEVVKAEGVKGEG
jgi:hypothetical protein